MLHPLMPFARVRVHGRGCSGLLFPAGVLLFLGILVGVGTFGTAAAPTSQCVVCHTDAAKLKALTPPDPPTEEEGEG